MDILVLSKILGHSDPSTTLNKYGHALPNHKKDNMEKIRELYFVQEIFATKFNNKETDEHVILIKKQLLEHFRKTEPNLTTEQLNNRVNEVAREILLYEMKKAQN